MTTKKKVLLTIGLAVLNSVAVYGLIFYIQNLIETTEAIKFQISVGLYPIYLVRMAVRQVVFSVFFLASLVVNIVIFTMTNKLNFFAKAKKYIQYSYQDYKDRKREKKKARLERKKEKLEKEIDNLK